MDTEQELLARHEKELNKRAKQEVYEWDLLKAKQVSERHSSKTPDILSKKHLAEDKAFLNKKGHKMQELFDRHFKEYKKLGKESLTKEQFEKGFSKKIEAVRERVQEKSRKTDKNIEKTQERMKEKMLEQQRKKGHTR